MKKQKAIEGNSMENIFGEDMKTVFLRDRYIEPPFSVLDSKQGRWQNRKKKWLNLGILSEIGRTSTGGNTFEDLKNRKNVTDSIKRILSVGGQSIFDPVLTELMYTWFCPKNGEVLDPFAGGSVRGIVANSLGYKYTGIELRQEQIDSNIIQAKKILKSDNQPTWICGDSNKKLNKINKQFDFILSCPPYFDLEKYSELPNDLSNMDYVTFSLKYQKIIRLFVNLLKPNCYIAFIVSDVRNKQGNYYGFVADTIKYFQKESCVLYNDAILLNPVGSACIRADGNMKNKKLVKIHQNILIFKKQ